MYLDEEDDDLIEGDLIEGISNDLLAKGIGIVRKEQAKESPLTTMCFDISHLIPILAANDELLIKYPDAHQHILACDYCWDKYMDACWKGVL